MGLAKRSCVLRGANTTAGSRRLLSRENDELVAITQELTAKMREMRTVDWQKKQSARAAMRVAIKRLLKHHKYPPEAWSRHWPP
ncbi:MAG: type I restriction enzyme endonuclease domain-containing protein [Collinsella sp.]